MIFVKESFAILLFSVIFTKVCSHNIIVIYNPPEFVLAKKKCVLDPGKSKHLKIKRYMPIYFVKVYSVIVANQGIFV